MLDPEHAQRAPDELEVPLIQLIERNARVQGRRAGARARGFVLALEVGRVVQSIRGQSAIPARSPRALALVSGAGPDAEPGRGRPPREPHLGTGREPQPARAPRRGDAGAHARHAPHLPAGAEGELDGIFPARQRARAERTRDQTQVGAGTGDGRRFEAGVTLAPQRARELEPPQRPPSAAPTPAPIAGAGSDPTSPSTRAETWRVGAGGAAPEDDASVTDVSRAFSAGAGGGGSAGIACNAGSPRGGPLAAALASAGCGATGVSGAAASIARAIATASVSTSLSQSGATRRRSLSAGAAASSAMRKSARAVGAARVTCTCKWTFPVSASGAPSARSTWNRSCSLRAQSAGPDQLRSLAAAGAGQLAPSHSAHAAMRPRLRRRA